MPPFFSAASRISPNSSVAPVHQQEIDVPHHRGIAQDLVAAAADVAGKKEPLLLSAVVLVDDLQQDLRRAEDVAGVEKGQRHPVGDRHRPLVAERHELAQAALGVLLHIERFDRRQAVLGAVLVEPLGVLLVDVGAVVQHDLAQVARCEGRVDVAREALLAEVRQVAAVVDVGVGKHDQIDLLRVEVRKPAVHLVALLAAALVESAIEQDTAAVDFQQVLRTGGGARGTAEFQFHGLVRKQARAAGEGNGKVPGARRLCPAEVWERLAPAARAG